MRSLFFLLLTFQFALLSAQSKNLSGEWEGHLIQDPYGDNHKYEIKFVLDHLGGTVVGKSYSGISIDSLNANAELALNGSFYGSKFLFKEYKIQKKDIKTDSIVWCLKSGNLVVITEGNTQVMYGTFTAKDSEGYNCKGGEIYLKRTTIVPVDTYEEEEEEEPEEEIIFDSETGRPIKLLNRRIKDGETVDVYTSKVGLNIFDYKAKDGDQISLYYNGQWIVRNYTIEDGNLDLLIDVNPRSKDNYLILYAHNLGDTPPNTAGVSFYNGEANKKHIMNSDLGECDVLYFDYIVK